MFKKWFLIAISLICPLSANAGFLYLSPSLFYQAFSYDNFHYDGLAPNVSLGYGTFGIFDESIYLSGEVFWNFTSWKLNEKNPTIINLKPSYSYGASFLPGMKLNKILLGFFRIGVEATRFNNLDTTRNGLQLGIGLSAQLSKSWQIRAEYEYTKYKATDIFDRIKKNQVSLGVVYRFC